MPKLGMMIVEWIAKEKPGVARADAEDCAEVLNDLATSAAGTLTAIYLHHGEGNMRSAAAIFLKKIESEIADITGKTMELASKKGMH